MQRLSIFTLIVGVAALVCAAPASAGNTRSKPVSAVDRDCTPINGRYGYYGNPWCDTGSYRLEDSEYRERQAQQRRTKVRRVN
jgi:hypothetical protein